MNQSESTNEAEGSCLCEHCGAPLREGATFCGKCGHSLEPAPPAEPTAIESESQPGPQCPQCGAVLREGATLCGKCGYTLEVDAPPETCPGCSEKCEFVNVTCYVPDCGDTGSDPRLGS